MASYDQRDYDFLYKLILTGDSGVGKTQLLSRYCRGEFETESKATVGAEFATKVLRLADHGVKIQVWDTAGHERYRSITTAFYRGAKGALLCFDITDHRSFHSLDDWVVSLRDNADPGCCVLLVGCKSDLADYRQVSKSEAEQFAMEHNLVGYMETSAKDAINVDDTFYGVVEAMYTAQTGGDAGESDQPSSEPVSLHEDKPKPKSQCAC
eukprot:Filipodium_phascolosomae@DN4786_c0_g1_i1.p1